MTQSHPRRRRAGAFDTRPWAALAALLLALVSAGCAHTGPATAPPAGAGASSGAAASSTAAAAAGEAWGPRAVGGADCSRTEGYDAIVVGAGLAGLTAAQELIHLGRSVLILEAADRIGGRGHVAQIDAGGPGSPPVPIDYGGAWIHGVPTNPLTEVVDRMGFVRVRSQLEVPFYVDGRQATPEEDAELGEAWELYEAGLEEAAVEIQYQHAVAEQACTAGERIEAGELTAGELCARLGRQVADRTVVDRLCGRARQIEGGGLDAELFCAEAVTAVVVTSDVAADYVPRDERFAEVVPLLVGSAGPLESAAELAASSAIEAGGFEAGEDDLVDRGLGAFVEEFGAGLPACLRSPVERIEYREEGVTVEAAGRRYRAAHALVTVSVGVLQAGRIAFDPPLPEWKRRAIERLPMGHMQKVILPFSGDVFGGAEPSSWVMVETAIGDAERELARRHGSSVADQARRAMAFVLRPLGSDVAIGFYGGEWARLFEGECRGIEHGSGPRSASGCDDLAIGVAVRALAEIYGEEAIAGALLADRVHVTRWSLDPNTLGSYSAAVPGGWDQRAVLAEPVAAGADESGPLRLFFAGEACSRTMYNGSYAGAWETGLAAARAIHVELAAEPGPPGG